MTGSPSARTGPALRTVIVGDRDEDFANETNGLGASRGPVAWKLGESRPTKQERMAVLATDGVADNLIPERLDGFCDWLVEAFLNLAPAERRDRLAAELRPGQLLVTSTTRRLRSFTSQRSVHEEST